MITLYFIGRYPRDVTEAYSLGVKDDDQVFLTAGARWSRDWEKGVCFLTEQAAETFRRRLRWTDRERSEVVPVSAEFA